MTNNPLLSLTPPPLNFNEIPGAVAQQPALGHLTVEQARAYLEQRRAFERLLSTERSLGDQWSGSSVDFARAFIGAGGC